MRVPWPATVVFTALLCLASGCSGPKTAPPPAMGDLSGAWLFESEGGPVRFVDADGDTLALAVGSEPLMLRQGQAVSDTSIVIDLAGLFVSGGRDVSKGLGGNSEAEFVTKGPSAGTLTFRASALSFLGKWNGRGFAGHFELDEERAGKDVEVLDPRRAWTLRRLGGDGISH